MEATDRRIVVNVKGIGDIGSFGNMLEWPNILKSLFHQIDKEDISSEQVKTFLDHRNPFETIIDWQDFYSEIFKKKMDFSDLKIPEKKKGFNRLIIVADGMTSQIIYDKCKELFPSWIWESKTLDCYSDRNAEKESYAIWIRDRVEADRELRNFSVNYLKNQGIFGITCEERLLYELKYFLKTGKHLDVKNLTICSGSRYHDGNVPVIQWYDYKLEIGRYYVNCHSVSLSSREVIF